MDRARADRLTCVRRTHDVERHRQPGLAQRGDRLDDVLLVFAWVDR
jgi:hypothetical protein